MRRWLSLGVWIVVCLTSVAKGEERPPVYVGIEVGSGGVKGVTLTMPREGGGSPDVSESKFKSSLPVGLVKAKFSAEVAGNVFDAVRQLQNDVPGDVPAERRFLVFSSGVVAQADRLGRREVLEGLRSRITSELKLRGELISVEREVQLEFAELTSGLDATARGTSLLVDIGSGNIKFGAPVDGTFRVGEVLAGIGSPGDDPLLREVRRHLADQRERQGLAKIAPRRVYLSGGAFFSLLAFGQPGDLVAAEPGGRTPRFATLRPETLERYRKWVSDGAPDAALASLEGLPPERRAAAQRISEIARKVISAEQRPKALALIEAVVEEFGLASSREVELLFPVEGQYAWLSGYVREQIRK